ncbi:hypothetical protein BGZ94_009703 [Podila epigama]|nr:hypothetical protein BGZ94_009703 [Podila epigama]
MTAVSWSLLVLISWAIVQKTIGPISFFNVFRHVYSTIRYVSLFSEALKSRDPNIVHVGQEMKRLWNANKITTLKYWSELELESIQFKNISKSGKAILEVG